jgi:hypothetical protein
MGRKGMARAVRPSRARWYSDHISFPLLISPKGTNEEAERAVRGQIDLEAHCHPRRVADLKWLSGIHWYLFIGIVRLQN